MVNRKKDYVSLVTRIIIVTTLAVATLFIYFEYSEYSENIQRIHHKSETLNRILEERTTKMADLTSFIFETAEEKILEKGIEPFKNTTQEWSWFSSLANRLPENGSLWFLDENGKLLFSSKSSSAPNTDFSDRLYFQKHLAGAPFFIGPAIKGRITKTFQFTISKRVTNKNGKFIGVLLAVVEFSTFESVVNTLSNSNGSVTAIYKSDSSLVFRQDMEEKHLNLSISNSTLFKEMIPRSSSGRYQTKSAVDGIERIYHYTTLKDLDLILISGFDLRVELGIWRAHLLTNSILTAVVIFLLFLFRKLAVRYIHEQEEITLLKSNIISTISHELRTPMNAVIGYCDLALLDPTSNRVPTFLNNIMQSSQIMMDLINDILDFASIERGALKTDSLPINLEEILDELQKVLLHNANRKGVQFIVNIDPTIPKNLLGDRRRLLQVLLNLGGNGIKFTERGSVKLNIQRTNENEAAVAIHFSITDTGIGIAKEDYAKLFQAFSQIDNSVRRKYPGTGLGLKISQEIVKLLGGEITIQSEQSKGTTFSFTLPFSKQI